MQSPARMISATEITISILLPYGFHVKNVCGTLAHLLVRSCSLLFCSCFLCCWQIVYVTKSHMPNLLRSCTAFFKLRREVLFATILFFSHSDKPWSKGWAFISQSKDRQSLRGQRLGCSTSDSHLWLQSSHLHSSTNSLPISTPPLRVSASKCSSALLLASRIAARTNTHT